ncbi:MAG: hydantoinase/oxoprolinase family protein [Armatimonadetes bacterium]|nr:hydantoinase/oxoprolinase family protein [Armatimonadota bacterium]
MRYGLGIDTGGTYTDAAVVDFEHHTVVASAKALTTRHHLADGIIEALRALPLLPPAHIRLVSLSTTLATNAIVEGQGGRVCLILMGYEPKLLEDFGLREMIPVPYRLVAGKHGLFGEEVESLDMQSIARIVEETAAETDAYAVSGYFSVRNPAHEREVKAYIAERAGRPVVCGHELTSELNSVKRAATAALNARLIPTLKELLRAVRHALDEMGIQAPLVVVKGDGSLMAERVALERPIETILSGPAASAIGGQFLSGEEDCIVVDMGGTTTDIALLNRGLPRLRPEGATVGPWKTSVQAADIRTAGLGGDSHIRTDRLRQVSIGPRRAVPLCLLAHQYPGVLSEMELLRDRFHIGKAVSTDFLMRAKKLEGVPLAPREEAVWEALAEGPCSLTSLASRLKAAHPSLLYTERLESLGLAARAGLTPTDVLHALGRYRHWNEKASTLALRIFAGQINADPEILGERILEAVPEKIGVEIFNKLLPDGYRSAVFPGEGIGSLLWEQSLGKRFDEFDCTLKVHKPIVAVGAPAGTYLPVAAQKLRTRVIVPPFAEVANAVGAVTGSVMRSVTMQVEAVWTPVGIAGYFVVGADGREEFEHLPEALAYAEEAGRAEALRQMQDAGGENPEMRVETRQHAPQNAEGQTTYLGTTLHITAIGRPRMAAEG